MPREGIPVLEAGPGWPRMLELQGLARINIPSGDFTTSEMTPLVAQVYATLALSEAIMTASSDTCDKLEKIRWQLDQLYAAVSSLPGAS